MIIITGATGHLGNNFARLLSSLGIEQTLLVRQITPALEGIQATILTGDIFDSQWIRAILHEGDTFVHFAAYIDLSNQSWEECLRVNDIQTRVLFDLCKELHVRFIFLSSVDAFGRHPKDKHVSIPSMIVPDEKRGSYAYSKARASQRLMEMMQRQEIQGAIIFPTAVIGPHDYKPSRAGKEMIHVSKHRILFSIRGGYNFIDVRDVAKCTWEIVKNQMEGYFLLGNQEVTIRALYREIMDVKQHRSLVIGIPRWIARFFIRFVPGYTSVMIDAVTDNYHYDLSSMQSLQVEMTPFRQTIVDTLSWFEKQEKKSQS